MERGCCVNIGKFCVSSKAVLLSSLGIYVWLTNLAPLTGTETYYSVYLLCGIAGILCLFDNFWRQVSCSRREASWIGIFSFLFSLAVLLANYGLFDPLNVLEHLFNWCCCLLGGICVACPILLWMLSALPIRCTASNRNRPLMVFWLSFGAIAAIFLAFLVFVRYPGFITRDSRTTIAQLMGEVPYDNVMPFWHTMLVKVFMELGFALFHSKNAAIALFHGAQILFMAACFAYVIVTLYQMKLPTWTIAIVFALYGLMPYNIAYSVTLWKDIPFSGAIVLFLTGLYRLLKGIGKSKLLNYGAMTAGAVGFCLLRTNGWFAFAVTVLLMTLFLWKRQRKLLLILFAVLVFCWILLNPVLTILNVKGSDYIEALAVPFQQIARIISQGRPLSDEEQALLGQVFYLDIVEEVYDPLTVDPIKYEALRDGEYLFSHLWDYIGLYLRLGLRYPGDYLKAWIDETKGYWNAGYQSFFWVYTKGIQGNTAIPGGALVTRLYDAYFRYMEKIVVLQPLTSIGLHVWLLIGCALVNFLKKREELLIAVPILALTVGLWFGTPVYAEFRYAYPIFLSMPLIAASTIFSVEKGE